MTMYMGDKFSCLVSRGWWLMEKHGGRAPGDRWVALPYQPPATNHQPLRLKADSSKEVPMSVFVLSPFPAFVIQRPNGPKTKKSGKQNPATLNLSVKLFCENTNSERAATAKRNGVSLGWVGSLGVRSLSWAMAYRARSAADCWRLTADSFPRVGTCARAG